MILKRENEKWEHNVTYPHPISNFITNFPFSHSSLPVPVLSDPNFFFFLLIISLPVKSDYFSVRLFVSLNINGKIQLEIFFSDL